MSYIQADKISKQGLADSAGVDYAITCASAVAGSTVDKCLCTVSQNVNWNAGIGCKGMYFPGVTQLFAPNCYSMDEVRAVLTTYRNLTQEKNEYKRIPIYDREKNPSAIEQIEKSVAKHSGIVLPRTKAILWELYWAWKKGTLKSDYCINPLQYAASEQIRYKNPEGWLGFMQNAVAAIAKALSVAWTTAQIIFWVALGTGAVVGGVYVYKLLPKPQSKSTNKQLTSGVQK